MLLALVLVAAAPIDSGPTPYWQQRVVYQIGARLDESSHTIAGTETLRYVNRSPDTLHTISFHLYLNAFRPGSRWSAADAAEGVHRFDRLSDPDYGYNHVSDVTIDGIAVTPIWPLAPDSTIVRFDLPAPLVPGDSLTVAMSWSGRPSVPPRRQGWRGRHYDLAQWYPAVVVYDRYGWEEHALYPAGEFYGEFGDFFVRLDVPSDDVVGATGVPVCGDPGWTAANRDPAHPVVTGGEALAIAAANGCTAQGTSLVATDSSAAGRKQLLWVARDVHRFALTLSPDYRYEGGEWNGTLVHVLYQPGDDSTWGHGIVVERTITTLRWLATIFGPYAWPQMTVVHRIENGGGSEAPMMQMNASPTQGLNLHEGGHSYLMGILANNEWRNGWMDEGFTSFQTDWWSEARGQGDGPARSLEAQMLLLELNGDAQPVSLVSEDYRDFNTYNEMIYNRGELFFQELKRMVGDETMLRILRTYYARWKLHHVDEQTFESVAEEVSHRDLSAFFAQWLHGVVLTDYAVRGAKRRRTATGWETTVQVERKAPGQFPAMLAVLGAHDTAVTRIAGIARRESLTVATRSEPRKVLLDPLTCSHDWDMLNNQRTLGFSPLRAVLGDEPTAWYFDTWFSARARRDARTVGLTPVVWYDDPAGVVAGVHLRENYLGQFDRLAATVTYGTGAGAVDSLRRREFGVDVSLQDPTWWRVAHGTTRLAAFRVEGRAGAAVSLEHSHQAHLGFGPVRSTGASLAWTATYDTRYLDPALWDDGGTLEGRLWTGYARAGAWSVDVRLSAAGGVMYARPGDGITTAQRYDGQLYARPELELSVRHDLGHSLSIGMRGYAAGVFSADPVIAQRRLYAAGADPYQQMDNPFLRTVGAPLGLTDCWCRWQTPGGGDLRGFDQTLSSDRLAAFNAELSDAVLAFRGGVVRRVTVALFADAGVLGRRQWFGGAGDSPVLALYPRTVFADAGFGVRLEHRIGRTTFETRIDVPLLVSTPAYAIARVHHQFAPGRVVFAVSPVIP